MFNFNSHSLMSNCLISLSVHSLPTVIVIELCITVSNSSIGSQGEYYRSFFFKALIPGGLSYIVLGCVVLVSLVPLVACHATVSFRKVEAVKSYLNKIVLGSSFV